MNWLSLVFLALQPEVIAHRGGAAHWPENSMQAFQSAIAAGVKVIETDAVLTSDDRVALNHDLNTPKGPIRLNKFSDLNRPALEDLLALIQGKKLSVMLETKMAKPGDKDYVEPAYVVQKIDALIRKFNLAPQIILQSFDHQTLIEMHKIHPQIRLCLLNPRTRLENYVAPAKAIGAQIQFINFRIIEKRDVDALHAAGLKVFSGTTSEPADWKKLIEMNVDGILTDDPLGLQKLLAAKAY